MNNNDDVNTRSSIIGGKVIDSGGFGCVFSPSLKCKGDAQNDKNKISKLMTEKHALDEYNEISKIKKNISEIPNYADYFLLNDFVLCNVEKLTKDDLTNYDKKCSALKKDDITEKNINENLDKLLSLTMPYGGISVDKYLYQSTIYENIIKLNDSLMNLLKYAILPMNNINIYHCDIKDNNILVNIEKNKMYTRLIDWGLSTKYIPHSNQTLPKTWRNRPLQFNVPFSVILFTDFFYNKYSEYLENGGEIDYISLKPFIVEYIYLWMNERGKGHYKTINNIMYMLFFNDLKNTKESDRVKVIESDYTIPYISNYIIEILVRFTKKNSDNILNLRKYIDDIYIQIVDVYGLLITYLPIIEILHENNETLNNNEKKLFNHLKNLFIEYLYKPNINGFNTDNILDELKEINNFIKDVINKNKHKKTASLKSSHSKRLEYASKFSSFYNKYIVSKIESLHKKIKTSTHSNKIKTIHEITPLKHITSNNISNNNTGQSSIAKKAKISKSLKLSNINNISKMTTSSKTSKASKPKYNVISDYSSSK